MKIVINKCYGGFGYSDLAKEKYDLPQYSWECGRDDPKLIKAVEELGEKVNTPYSKLKVVEIPDGTRYEIDEYDGMESIEEEHNSWS